MIVSNRVEDYAIEANKVVATARARALTVIFIAEISLSTSCRNWMIKSMSLCFHIFSKWVLVTKKEMSNPCECTREHTRPHTSHDASP
jgi:hypothetical protein